MIASNDLSGAEELLSKLSAHKATRVASGQRPGVAGGDFFVGPRGTEPEGKATLWTAAINNHQVPSYQPSRVKRAMRSFARFLLAAGIGVAGTLAWQSYGEEAKQMIVARAPQLGWLLALPSTTLSPKPGIAGQEPIAPVAQVAATDAATQPFARTGPDTATPITPAALHPELVQQLDALARELAAMRQAVDQLITGQQQSARDIAMLQVAERDIRQKMSAPPPRPAAASVRQPAPTVPPRQSPSQVSPAPLVPAPARPSPPVGPPLQLQ